MFLGRCCQWKWGPFTGSQEKHFWKPMSWRMRRSGEIYWNRNGRLLPGSQCPSLSVLLWQKYSLAFFRPSTVLPSSGLEIGPVSWKSVPCQSPVQFSLCPCLDSPCSRLLLAGTVLPHQEFHWDLLLEYLSCQPLYGCYGERMCEGRNECVCVRVVGEREK